MALTPINGCVLVELTGDLQYIETPEAKYATHTNGIVVACDTSDEDSALEAMQVGNRIYFEAYKDVEVVKDDKKYAFVKIEDIRGYEQADIDE